MRVSKDKGKPPATELRGAAEEQLRKRTPGVQLPRTNEVTQRLVHELEVHQIELEMQNEELLQARDEMDRALKMYTDLYDFAPVGYFTLDRAGTIRAVNLSGAALLEVDRSRLIGSSLTPYFTEGNSIVFGNFLSNLFRVAGKDKIEIALKTEVGTSLFVLIEATVADSRQMCRVAVINITELKQSQESIARLNNELEGRVKERTEALEESNKEILASYKELEVFSYAVAHDLRTPLRSMAGFSSILLEDYAEKLDETSKEMLRKIEAAGSRMGQLVDGILNLSQLTRAKVNRTNIDLSSMALDVANILRELEPERTVVITIAEGVTAYGDSNLIRLVLENLLGNAWKYTSKVQFSKIDFGSCFLNGETVYFVRDNGIGFDMSHIARLYIPFERLHGLDEYKGIGIGLATVQRVVARHEGRIWAEGAPRIGATFFFTLSSPIQGKAHALPPKVGTTSTHLAQEEF